ncbi:MAG: imidazole glycerol phosphate synthase subunit HisH [Desulfovibrionaceae bacterium]|nr:imidazole glycerol phosphate synthase subunit HisH [Desulfovibrionaceae bacterium]
MIALIDLGMGNLASVLAAFQRVGAEVRVTDRPEDTAAAAAVILPGVGTFGDGMACLRARGLLKPLLRHAAEGRPLLGICLGMQLLADLGEEHGKHRGLGILPGRVARLRPKSLDQRVPNMGWCDVHIRKKNGLFRDVAEGESFYFAHSYHLICDKDTDQAAVIDYGGEEITAAVERDNVFGLQFHPEKSQDAGLDVLSSVMDRILECTQIVSRG